MPGQHNQEKYKFVGVWIHTELITRIDAVRGETGRSQFLRDAVAEKIGILTRQAVPREFVAAPDRAGKGRPKAKAQANVSPDETLGSNAERTKFKVRPSSTLTRVEAQLLKKGVASVLPNDPK